MRRPWKEASPRRAACATHSAVVVTVHARKTRHVSCTFQYVAASSKAKQMPPSGDEKAAATPAAAPAETKSRFCPSVRSMNHDDCQHSEPRLLPE